MILPDNHDPHWRMSQLSSAALMQTLPAEMLATFAHHNLTSICLMNPYSILLVCTDNLCRSPTAEEVLRQKATGQGLADRLSVASAATHDLNAGEPIDFHAQKHAMRRGYDLSGMTAKLLRPEDFERFDLILAMEESNLLLLRLSCAPKHQDKLHYFTEYCSEPVSQDVPDPFYGQPDDFEQVLDVIEDGCEGVLRAVKEKIEHGE